MYYNGASILNNGCPISFSVGNRSTGKSFFWKRYCIRNFIKKNEQFIYIRRNYVDIEITNESFFDDIQKKFPGYKMTQRKNSYYLQKGDEEPVKCGYFYALTEVKKLKSMVLDRVNTIFFDEFLPDDNKYLNKLDPSYEPKLIFSIYLTVARGYKTPIREEVKFVAVSNNISLFNPYFSFFKLDLTKKNRVTENYVYAELTYNKEIAELIENTKIGQIMKGTSYGDMAIGNKMLFNYDRHVCKMPKKTRLFCMLYCYEWFMVFTDEQNFYIKDGYSSTCKRKFRVIGDVEEDMPLYKGDIVKLFKKQYINDRIFYTSQAVKSRLAGFLEIEGG